VRGQECGTDNVDEGVITPLASHETMAERASALADKAGKAIGDRTSAIGATRSIFDPKQAIDSLSL